MPTVSGLRETCWPHVAACLACAVFSMAGPMLKGADEPASESRGEEAKPQWIWSSRPRTANQQVFFRKMWSEPGEVEHAQLDCVADFCGGTVYLNGQEIGTMEDYGPPLQLDVGPLLQRGDNLLAVRAHSSATPAAIAVRLQLVRKDGSRASIVSDATWPSSSSEQAEWETTGFRETGWANCASFGDASQDIEFFLAQPLPIDELDDYTQWKRALETDRSTEPSSFLVPPAFEIELVRSAHPDEGSWVSLAFDPRGRLVVAREDRGLLRFTLPADRQGEIRVETIDDTLEECRGLLFAFGDLYANANNSKGFYRLRDTNGDDRFDEVKLLYGSPGGVGHGRNDLVLGPDNLIYSIHGDAVDLPSGLTSRLSPFREQGRGIATKEGHLVRFDRDGENGELIAAGLRNPFGIDFNEDGELFTYDADAEFDMGAPWYRPTRVDHLVTGADFGWRGVTGSWPPYYPDHPDNALPNLDVGKGSPTAVKFGTHSKFPPRYRQALFILDWAYGRVIAVHTMARGSSYLCRGETFVRGRPLNVTDLDFGLDGAMYIVTGGRKTQSGLYRIRYTGPVQREPGPTLQQTARKRHAVLARQLRRSLEAFHGREDRRAIDQAWPQLDHADPRIRYAARVAIESQPLAWWQQRALDEPHPAAAVACLTALARSNQPELKSRILERLLALSWDALATSQKQAVLHITSLCTAPPGDLSETVLQGLRERLAASLPDKSAAVNRELARLLMELDVAAAVPQVLDLLESANRQEDQLHYLFVLRQARSGWRPELRRSYFQRLAGTTQFQGGEGMPGFIRQIQSDALAAAPADQRQELERMIEGPQHGGVETPSVAARPLVRNWKLDDLSGLLDQVGAARDFQQGKAMYSAALCVRCHRLGREGQSIGPDLTGVSSRFGRRDLLLSILEPSRVVAEQYRSVRVVTDDGQVLLGRIVPSSDYRDPLLRLAVDPLQPAAFVEIPKSTIESHETTEISPMPNGLLDTLTEDEILDLLAYVEAGGDKNRANFRPPTLQSLPDQSPAPDDNPTTAEKVSLGKTLFFDNRLSGDNKMSCATCHIPEKAFADGEARSRGAGGRLLERHTPTVLNTAWLSRLFWDGRAGSLEEQALGPIQSPAEMNRDLDELERELSAVPYYREQFAKAFAAPVTRDGIAKALAAFQRTLVTRKSPLDEYLAGNTEALSPAAKRGLELFRGDAGCIRCHNGPLLSDGKFYRLGVGSADKGLAGITMRREDLYKFRTPPLRNVAETAPYMHDGSLKSLTEVVEFYFRTAPQRGPEGLPLDIEPLLDGSYSDIDALVAFLKSLSGELPRVVPPAIP